MTQQHIKTYTTGWTGKAQKKFEKDAAQLAKQGWRVQTVTSSGANPFGDPRSLTVVYTR